MTRRQVLKWLILACFVTAEAMTGGCGDSRALSPSDIKIDYYFGSTSPSGSVTVDKLVTTSSYNPSNPTFMVTHGWGSSIKKNWVLAIKNAIIAKEPTANVFLVDWSPISQNLLYPVAKIRTVYVGQQLANFIRNNRIDANRLHVIAHSLGAHVAGIAGYKYSVLTGQKLARITGLDPATPLYSKAETPLTEKLDKSDADFVDTIFTSMAFFRDIIGVDYSVGHVNFFPNGGDSQPGCLDEITLDLAQFLALPNNRWKFCSHSRAADLFVDSLTKDNLVGYRCSFKNLINGQCYSTTSNRLGYSATPSNPGDFVLTTRSTSPFANDDFNVLLKVNNIDAPLGFASGSLSMVLPQSKKIVLVSPLLPISKGQSIRKLASVPVNSLAKGSPAGVYWLTVSFVTSGTLRATITLSTPDSAKVLTVGKDPSLKNGVGTVLTMD